MFNDRQVHVAKNVRTTLQTNRQKLTLSLSNTDLSEKSKIPDMVKRLPREGNSIFHM